METEPLVVIATFNNAARADEAQGELQRAGIHGLLVSAPPEADDFNIGNEPPVSLAVNQRDAAVARALLSPTLDAN